MPEASPGGRGVPVAERVDTAPSTAADEAPAWHRGEAVPPRDGWIEERVLVLMSLARDARLAGRVLERQGFAVRRCEGLRELVDELDRGAGMAIIAGEAFGGEGVERLAARLRAQPAWSSFPLIFLTGGRAPLDRRLEVGNLVERLGNVTFLERPLRIVTLVSTVRALMDGRRRQYEVRDLLERLEQGVRQRDQFLAILGHELRNPLGAIRSSLGILVHRAAGELDRRRSLDILERQTVHLSRLVDDLLDVSRVTRDMIELDRRPLPLRRAVESAVEVARPAIDERRHRLRVSLPEEEVRVYADPTRLDQVLTNLLGNAAKYTEPGGTIWIEARREAGMAELRVRDTGIGMTPELRERIFNMFEQADRGQGLGLGLTLARKLVELHGGTIEAHSPGSGGGSEFVVRLPLHG